MTTKLIRKATTIRDFEFAAMKNVKTSINFIKNGATHEELIALLNTTTKNMLDGMRIHLGHGCFSKDEKKYKKDMVNTLAYLLTEAIKEEKDA